MKIGPKYKIARRLNAPVFEKTQTQKYALSSEKKSKIRPMRSRTTYGIQLLEKQKARFFYGITEKQFKMYVKKALSKKGRSPVEELISLLEKRLDNAIWRVGLAPTHRAARQLVSHGHILVNGKRTHIPSFQLVPKDIISVRKTSKEKNIFNYNLEQDRGIPNWLSFDLKKMEALVKSNPTIENKEPIFDLGQVIEFYQR